MTRMIFVNLYTADLAASETFYTGLGFTKNDQFSDDSTASFVWSDAIVVMVMTRDKFAGFTPKQQIDPKTQVQALFAFSAESRDEVDAFVANGLANGGAPAGDKTDMGFMYGHSVEDPDGNVLEIVYMDMSQMPAE